ncbi:hypothetical protein GCM10010430_75550 [Kitasatospora cystarginea]|uniref:Helicase/UvrB N-terminal domain-containing protein n=1 Tax=Kitasatospora cystarginea TaxID=58350 RepID=A0ABN3EZX0_9ACTN
MPPGGHCPPRVDRISARARRGLRLGGGRVRPLAQIGDGRRDFGLPAWDLVVVDEAHRTTRSDGKPWAGRPRRRPGARRPALVLHRHPAVDGTRVPHEVVDVAEGTMICSMDDERIYGPTVYRWSLGQGTEHGYLADYRVLVPLVTDEDLCELLDLPAVAGLKAQRSNEDLFRRARCRSRCCARSPTSACAGSSPSIPGSAPPARSPPTRWRPPSY